MSKAVRARKTASKVTSKKAEGSTSHNKQGQSRDQASVASHQELLAAIQESTRATNLLAERVERLEDRQNTASTSAEPSHVDDGGEPACPIPFTHRYIENQIGINSSAVPVGARISHKLRLSIVGNQLIDFASLVKREESSQDSFLSLTNDGKIKLVSNSPKPRKSLSWLDWCAAWNLYLGVLADANSNDSSFLGRMLKHGKIVIDLARSQKDWYHYDVEFRRLVSLGLANWGQIHTEVLNEAKACSGTLQYLKQMNMSHKGLVPLGFCER